MAELPVGDQLQMHEENIRLNCIAIVGDKFGISWLRSEEETKGMSTIDRLGQRAKDVVAAAKILEDYVRFPHMRG